MRILVVEDEALVADAVAQWLRGDAHAVDAVHDGGAALERVGVNDYDVVVLDRDLPVVHGDDVCRSIVDAKQSPRVLMLTAAADLDDRVAGLTLCADDYLPKPLVFAELSARVTALGRRARAAAPPVLQLHNLTDNAVRYNKLDEGWVRVRTATGPQESTVLVEVSNTGPVVPRYEVPGLFEPFHRLGTDRIATASPGAGLGLSIVQAIARVHGGEVRAEARDGGGLVVTVTLPASL